MFNILIDFEDVAPLKMFEDVATLKILRCCRAYQHLQKGLVDLKMNKWMRILPMGLWGIMPFSRDQSKR